MEGRPGGCEDHPAAETRLSLRAAVFFFTCSFGSPISPMSRTPLLQRALLLVEFLRTGMDVFERLPMLPARRPLAGVSAVAPFQTAESSVLLSKIAFRIW